MSKLSNTALWSLCQKYGGLALAYRRKFVALLPEVERRRLYKRHGLYSIYEFAAKVGGVSVRVADEVLRLDKRLSDRPMLQAQIAEVGWSKVAVVASITTKENESKIVEMVNTLPKDVIRTYSSQFKTVDELRKEVVVSAGCKLQSVTFKLDKETRFLLHKYQQKLERKKGEPIPLGQVLKKLLKQVDQPIKEPQKRESNSRKPSTYDKFKNNNEGKCSFPGCNKPHQVVLDPSHENITPLCEEHHKLAHAGLIANEQSPPDMELNPIDRKYQVYLQRTMFG